MISILCYHKIGPESEEGRRLNVAPETLESHVRFFLRRGWDVTTAQGLSGGWGQKTACFTFDDAYLSTMTHGVEVLDRCGVLGMFFAVSSLVGETSSWDGELARPLAGWDLLVAAAGSGHEIGNHTATHVRLGELDTDAQRREISTCDGALRAHGLEPSTFCYPYGSLNADCGPILREMGYKVGLTLEKRILRPSEDRLFLPRITVAFSDKLPMILYKMHVRPRLGGRKNR